MRESAFKFRFVNEITGAFVLLAIAILIAGIFLAGRAQGLFEPKFRLRAVFQAEEGTYGLKKGSEVRIRNTAAGSVTRIRPTAEGTIEAAFELKESFHNFVRTNSVAVVKKTLIVVGDSFVDISIGDRSAPLMPDGSLIACSPDKGITEQAQLVLEELRNTLHEHEALLQALSREDIHGQLVQFRATMRATQVLFEGFQRHWLFRGYMENPKSGSSTSPDSLILPAGGQLAPGPGNSSGGGTK